MRSSSALLDIAAALVLFLLSGLAVTYWSSGVPAHLRVPAVVVSQGILVLAVVGGVLAWRGQRWSDIWLVRPGIRDLPRSLLALGGCLGVNLVLVYALYGASPEIIEAHTERLGSIARQFTGGLSLPVLAAVLGFVGIYEEVFARGLLLARCRALLRGTWAPVLASSLLFGLGHLYQGWIGVGQTMLIGIVLAMVTIRWRTLWPAIAAHALLDISSITFMGAS